MRKDRLLILGAGSIGLRHARLAAERRELSVEVCDPDAAGQMAARAVEGVRRIWNSATEALATRPEFVVIAAPHHHHAELAVASLRGGARVLCEKPMSDSLEGAGAMLEADRSAGGALHVGFTHRFNPSVRLARLKLREGALGEPVACQYRAGSYIALENSRSRYQERTFGALPMDYSHGVDLVLWLTGLLPKGISASGITAECLPIRSRPNVISACFHYGAAFLSEFHFDHIAKPERHELLILGSEGWAEIDLLGGGLVLGRRKTGEREEVRLPFDRDEMFREQLKAVLAAPAPSDLCTAEEGWQATAAVAGIIEAIRQGSARNFPPRPRSSGR